MNKLSDWIQLAAVDSYELTRGSDSFVLKFILKQ